MDNESFKQMKSTIIVNAIKFAKKRLVIILFAALIVVSGLAVYFYGQASDWKAGGLFGASRPSGIGAKDETQKLITALSKLILLPEDETPTIATVSDLEALRGQPFFAKAKVGDKVLIYVKAKKAILYDPSVNKIVEVVPVNLGKNP